METWDVDVGSIQGSYSGGLMNVEFIPVSKLLTPDEIHAQMKFCMDMWQQYGTPENEQQYVKRYAELLKKKKELGSIVKGIKEDDLHKEVIGIVEMIESNKLLAHHKGEIVAMVKKGYTSSLHECVSAAMAMKKNSILSSYASSLPPESLAQLIQWIDKKIENKIKMHTEGVNAKPYIYTYEKAVSKYASTTGIEAAVTKLKTIIEGQNTQKPTKVVPPSAAAQAPSLAEAKKKLIELISSQDILDAVPHIPFVSKDGLFDISSYGICLPDTENVPPKMRGKLIAQVTGNVVDRWLKYHKTFASQFAAVSGDATNALLRCLLHNFFAGEFADGIGNGDTFFLTPWLTFEKRMVHGKRGILVTAKLIQGKDTY